MKFSTTLFLLIFGLSIVQCGTVEEHNNEQNTTTNMTQSTIMEVTTFSINSDVDPVLFSKRDQKIEKDFTSLQSGFIKRQSGVNEKGEYAVVVFWETQGDAEASMSKFMSDASVADYAQMIDGPTMKMTRFEMNEAFNANASNFVEVMTFKLEEGVDPVDFALLNKKVETDFTQHRDGFLQRLTGNDEAGTQAVAVYWENKEKSDASLEPFMNDETAKKFMQRMDLKTMFMGRYQFLNAVN